MLPLPFPSLSRSASVLSDKDLLLSLETAKKIQEPQNALGVLPVWKKLWADSPNLLMEFSRYLVREAHDRGLPVPHYPFIRPTNFSETRPWWYRVPEFHKSQMLLLLNHDYSYYRHRLPYIRGSLSNKVMPWWPWNHQPTKEKLMQRYIQGI